MTSPKQDLALRAALLPPAQGIANWQLLREQSTVEELDHSVTRVLPYVYENCKELLTGNDLLKLRGSRRHTWAKNTEFYMQFKPVLRVLHENAIDYRILKGGAINLLIGPPGFRVMGDIDLLVRKNDLTKVRKLLDDVGFKPKFSFNCPHHNPALENLELNFCNDQSLEIDIHVAEERAPRDLFLHMLQKPPLVKDFSGLPVKLPATEFLIAHALIHGGLRVQAEDEAQAILDVHVLLNAANFQAVCVLVDQLGVSDLLVTYLDKVAALVGASPFAYARHSPTLTQRLQSLPQKLWRLSHDIYTLLLAIRYRRPRISDALHIYSAVQRNRALYLIWLYTGMIRQVEGWAIQRRGGFMGQTAFKVNPAARWSNDWRFTIPANQGVTPVSLKLSSKSFEHQSFLVFVDGVLAGVTENSPTCEYFLRIDAAPIEKQRSLHEVSLRLPFAGCKACAQSMADLRIEYTLSKE